MEASPKFGLGLRGHEDVRPKPDHSADVIDLHSREGLFLPEHEIARQEALASLPEYDVHVVRRATHKRAETSEYGTFHQETVRYSDGAVRLTTIGIPHEPVSSHVVSGGDPWLTGPNGFNKIEIEQLVHAGFNVVWNHHHGRHATLPTNRRRMMTMLHFLSSKSIGKSAAHDRALLDHLEPSASFDTKNIFRKGYSRSAMSGEAFIATSNVLWSDLEATCFVQGVSHLKLMTLAGLQATDEVKAAAKIGMSIAKPDPDVQLHRRIGVRDYVDTIDAHPLNIAHELAWIRLFISGDAGMFARAIPLDSRGIRTTYSRDRMSQIETQEKIHEHRPFIHALRVPGAHVTGASPEMLHEKGQRWQKVAQYALLHEDDMSRITPADVLPAGQAEQYAQAKAA